MSDMPAASTPTQASFSAAELIKVKRDGGVLSGEQIDWLIDAYTGGRVAEEQMAAMLMAIAIRGLNQAELSRWTAAMIASGEQRDLSALPHPTVDKHSTGGVGDKISLILAPLAAACGACVPQLSGRGLGHTGGTLDKLEAIPGWRADVRRDEFLRQLAEVGAVICAADDRLVPADRKLYALRDITATVQSVPLIASSIMSKKIAEGVANLVLDVKVGSGAFMKSPAEARELAETMVEIGRSHNVRTVALLTDMSTPLGRAVGNAVEVTEAVEILSGGGPPDVIELTLALARAMLEVAGIGNVDPADALADGRAMDRWRAMIKAQGGDPSAPLPRARERQILSANATGTLTRLDAYAVGVASWRLGAGRSRKDEALTSAAGILIHAKPGDRVTSGQPLLELHADDPARFEPALAALADAVSISDATPPATPLVIERVE